MPIAKTIKPGGGGDYTTLAAWEVARQAAGGDNLWWAEVYSGGSVGDLTIGNSGMTPLANDFIKIYPGPGQQHNGTYVQSAAVVAQAGLIQSSANSFLQIFGMRLTGVTGGISLTSSSGDTITDLLIDSCLADDQLQMNIGPDDSGGSLSGTIVNSCAKTSINAGATTGPVADSNGCTVTAVITNCTATNFNIGRDSDGGGTGPATAVVTWKNNIALTGFASSNTGGGAANNVLVLTSDYLMSGNATASTFATHAFPSQTMSNVLTNTTNDWSLKTTSAARNAGTSLASFKYDIIGTSRPRGTGWDIGAFEFIEAVVSTTGIIGGRIISPNTPG